MFQHFSMQWYHWMTIGGVISLYMNCDHFRHWCHWILIRILKGWIWALKRTDNLHYEAPEQYSPPQTPPIKTNRQGKLEVNETDLQAWLNTNPQLSIIDRNRQGVL